MKEEGKRREIEERSRSVRKWAAEERNATRRVRRRRRKTGEENSEKKRRGEKYEKKWRER